MSRGHRYKNPAAFRARDERFTGFPRKRTEKITEAVGSEISPPRSIISFTASRENVSENRSKLSATKREQKLKSDDPVTIEEKKESNSAEKSQRGNKTSSGLKNEFRKVGGNISAPKQAEAKSYHNCGKKNPCSNFMRLLRLIFVDPRKCQLGLL